MRSVRCLQDNRRPHFSLKSFVLASATVVFCFASVAIEVENDAIHLFMYCIVQIATIVKEYNIQRSADYQKAA
jgi:hypothetical protein